MRGNKLNEAFSSFFCLLAWSEHEFNGYLQKWGKLGLGFKGYFAERDSRGKIVA